MKVLNAIPPDAVLLIPKPDEGDSPAYGIKPGYYNSRQMLELVSQFKQNPAAIHYIGDMLETGNSEDDGFALMLQKNSHDSREIARIIQICKDSD